MVEQIGEFCPGDPTKYEKLSLRYTVIDTDGASMIAKAEGLQIYATPVDKHKMEGFFRYYHTPIQLQASLDLDVK